MHTSGIDLPHFPQHLVRVDPTSFFAAYLSAERARVAGSGHQVLAVVELAATRDS